MCSCLRHTYATRLLRQGVSMEAVQRLLGHASPATTLDTYGHLTDADLRAALERVGALDSPPEVAGCPDPSAMGSTEGVRLCR